VAAQAVHLTKIYGQGETRVVALDRGGEFTAIMGPSGSGKSTLMHCLAGLDTVTAGSARLGATELTGLGDDQLTRLRRDRIGFVFQAFNLLPTLTAAENISLPTLNFGYDLYTAPRSVLDPRVYAELRIGESELTVVPRLPAYQADNAERPEGAPKDPQGTDECRFYRTVTCAVAGVPAVFHRLPAVAQGCGSRGPAVTLPGDVVGGRPRQGERLTAPFPPVRPPPRPPSHRPVAESAGERLGAEAAPRHEDRQSQIDQVGHDRHPLAAAQAHRGRAGEQHSDTRGGDGHQDGRDGERGGQDQAGRREQLQDADGAEGAGTEVQDPLRGGTAGGGDLLPGDEDLGRADEEDCRQQAGGTPEHHIHRHGIFPGLSASRAGRRGRSRWSMWSGQPLRRRRAARIC
jgi:ABC-type Fe3+/spermidine/putrescine transport system ATPase subunit